MFGRRPSFAKKGNPPDPNVSSPTSVTKQPIPEHIQLAMGSGGLGRPLPPRPQQQPGGILVPPPRGASSQPQYASKQQHNSSQYSTSPSQQQYGYGYGQPQQQAYPPQPTMPSAQYAQHGSNIQRHHTVPQAAPPHNAHSTEHANPGLLQPSVGGIKRSSASIRRLSMNPDARRSKVLDLPKDFLDQVGGGHSSSHPLSNEIKEEEEVPRQSAKRESVNLALQALQSMKKPAATASSEKGPRVFLVLGSRPTVAKRAYLGAGNVTLARIRERFTEEYSNDPGLKMGGGGEPGVIKMYVKDRQAGVYYELEDMVDVVDGSVIRLGEEVMDSSSIAMEKVMEKVEKAMSGMTDKVGSSADGIVAVKAGLEELKTLMMEKSVATAPLSRSASSASNSVLTHPQVKALNTEIRALRGELGAIRQSYTQLQTESAKTIEAIRQELALAQAGLASTNANTLSSKATAAGGARAPIISGMITMDTQTESIANKLEELSDLISELKTDVTVRGSRPTETRLKLVHVELAQAKTDLAALVEMVNRTKPDWKAIWEQELSDILKEQEFLKEQQELLEELEGDERALATVFTKLEQVVKIQEEALGNMLGTGKVVELDVAPPEEGAEVKGAVLQEIVCVIPDSEKRMRALMQAESRRKKEQELDEGDEFKRELGSFVKDSKLKKTGGADEVERRVAQRRKEVMRAMFMG